MAWLYVLNLNLYKIIIIAILGFFLFSSFVFIKIGTKDIRHRKRRRISVERVKFKGKTYLSKLKNEEYDKTLKRIGLPKFINSVYLNLTRNILGALLLLLMTIHFSGIAYLFSIFEWIILLAIPFSLVPKKPYPLYYILTFFSQKYVRRKNKEVYLLFNELKSELITKHTHFGNLYHTMKQLSTYYTLIQPAIHKMLPLLRDNKHAEAWGVFANEVGTKQADDLALVMERVEEKNYVDSLELMNQKHGDFRNELANDFKSYLQKRRLIMYAIVFTGGMLCFLNPWFALNQWTQDIMNAVNTFK